MFEAKTNKILTLFFLENQSFYLSSKRILITEFVDIYTRKQDKNTNNNHFFAVYDCESPPDHRSESEIILIFFIKCNFLNFLSKMFFFCFVFLNETRQHSSADYKNHCMKRESNILLEAELCSYF